MPEDQLPRMDKSTVRTRIVASGCLALAARVACSETSSITVQMATDRKDGHGRRHHLKPL